jgi:hypothetical protein
MRKRVLLLVAGLIVVGCGSPTTPTTPPDAKANTKLPPEVEFDPATATDKNLKNKKRPN